MKASSFELRDFSDQKLSRGRKREWTKSKRKRWEWRKVFSWQQSWLGGVWFGYFESRITCVQFGSSLFKPFMFFFNRNAPGSWGISLLAVEILIIVKSWFCYDFGCSNFCFTLSWQFLSDSPQKTSDIGKVPTSDSLCRKSWTGDSNLISRQFSSTDDRATADDWGGNLRDCSWWVLCLTVLWQFTEIYKLPGTKINVLKLLCKSILP